MKNIIFPLFLMFSVVFVVNAKQPTVTQLKSEISRKDSIIQGLRDSIASIPDTLCVTALDSTFCVPTKDAQEVVIPIVDYIKETSTNGWPNTGKEWLAWVLALVPLILSAKKLTAINNIWKILQPYLKTRLGLAVLSGGALSLLVTFLVSRSPRAISISLCSW